MERNTFIQNNDDVTTFDSFLEYAKIRDVGCEPIATAQSLDRISYKAVFAKLCDPTYNASAMDGIAVIAENTFKANELNPVYLAPDEDFVFVNTGGVISGKFNAVIMIEDINITVDEKAKIIAPAYPWQHVRTIGENIVTGEMIIPSKHVIRPADIGAMISGGVMEIEVFKRPSVGVFPTGSEIVETPEDVTDGKIIDSNSHMISALIKTYGGNPNRYSPVTDDYELLIKAVKKCAKENDLVIINAGTSAGKKDFTLKVIEELGEVFVHGIALKPGKPTILGIIYGKPVIGLPGYPVSAYLVCDRIIKPIVEKMTGAKSREINTVSATLTRKIVSSFKHREIVRVALGKVGERIVATPLDRGAAATMSLVRADGLLYIPRLSEGLDAGTTHEIELFKPLSEIINRLTIIGSHDLIIDLIADKINISSSHVGSMGGIMAMKNCECHIAPIHLLDEETGEYNISFIKKFLLDKKMSLIKGVGRLQGFIVAKGNPKNIKSFDDLKRYDIIYANRQRGAGTRILLDYHLKTNLIKGYDKEFSTHMAVAASIKSGSCDVGLGILSAAHAMDLDFVPVANEEYDFLIETNMLNDIKIIEFIEILKSKELHEQLLKLGGYTYEHAGEIIDIN